MEINKILAFLEGIAANNNREWFHAHKADYEAARESFTADIDQFIAALAQVDSSIAHLKAKDCLPTHILTSMRNEIMANEEQWLKAVENERFIELFGTVGEGKWSDESIDPKGFGMTLLKKGPKDFPTDYPLMRYLKMKDYCVWHTVDPSLFAQADWTDRVVEIMKTAKPMVDFVNAVIDDYE